MRLLIVKLSSIGDIVHTLPALAAIRRTLPDSEVHWVAERRCADVLRNNPMLESLIEVDTRALRSGKAVLGKTMGAAFRQFRMLRSSGLDLSIDFQGLYKSSAVSRLSGAKRRFGFSRKDLREPGSRHLLTDAIEVDSRQNVIHKNIDLAERALASYLDEPGFRLDRSHIEFPIASSEEDRASATSVAELAGKRFAILNPGGGWVTKLWRPEDYGALADRLYDGLGLVPVLTVGPGEETLADRVEAATRSGTLLRAELGIKGFYELARLADVYVGGDTGPTHLAVAADCPVVGIFGPTEWWRNGSIVEADLEVGRESLDCRIECHRRTCDKWVCMDIPVDRVFGAVKQRLG